MIVCKSTDELINNAKTWKKGGKTIGLVPTMGFLHEGHESLIKRARKENDVVIVSDFVNPIQFGPKEDLSTYPRDFDRDCKICENLGADLIFHPSPEEMYGEGFSTSVHVSGLTEGLCGASRPGHFDGVCTVVNKLFNMSFCDRAYFGQKDAQQLAVVRRMVKDLNMPLEIVGCPIVRESDGLAKSSRNVNLSDDDRKEAPEIQRALQYGKSLIEGGEKKTSVVVKAVSDKISEIPNSIVDYVEIVGWDNLEAIDEINGPILMACAVKLGNVRLIDNIIIE